VEPIPVGTVVNYTGSHTHGRYIVHAHQDPAEVFPASQLELVKDRHPDGVCYVLWPEGLPRKFGYRDRVVSRVKRASLEVTR